MDNIVLKVENISKQYRLGQLGTGTISHDLNRFWAKMRGKEDPYLMVGDVNDRAVSGGSDYVWSLKDINFEVKKGEVLGIIGKNGAGKSTLLKILSQVTTPTTGEVKIKGRIAALLEVGTGFHQDLTGRENIFLNGAILGMTKAEIKSKLDEIVEFSGVAKYLDTPVKRYSSGMTVRLGFAIAAHLEPEILVVDEVLAVGDAEFQEKCLGKMKDVSGQGRTVLFVSHNIQAIKAICTSGLLLENGIIKCNSTIEEAISEYVRSEDHNFDEELDPYKAAINIGEGHIKKIRLLTGKNSGNDIFYREPIKIEFEFELYKTIEDCISDVRIVSKEGVIIGYAMPKYDSVPSVTLNPGRYYQYIELDNNLQPDIYFLDIGIHYGKGLSIHYYEKILQFRVLTIGMEQVDYPVNWSDGNFRPSAKWQLEQM